MSEKIRRRARTSPCAPRPELRPIGTEWEWQLGAACRGADSDVFFAPHNERGRARRQREAQAKRVCMQCPVRTRCLQHAYAVDEPFGVWGGLSASERRALTADSA